MISTEKVLEINENITPQELDINLVEPNREQPRRSFNEDALQELADSIKQYGVLQPLLLQKKAAMPITPSSQILTALTMKLKQKKQTQTIMTVRKKSLLKRNLKKAVSLR